MGQRVTRNGYNFKPRNQLDHKYPIHSSYSFVQRTLFTHKQWLKPNFIKTFSLNKWSVINTIETEQVDYIVS